MKKNLLLLFGSLLIGFLLIEGLARLFVPQWAPRAGRLTQFWQYDARYGWSNIPGAKGAFQSFGFDTNVTINDRGFRGPAIPYERTPGKKRIEILGDSYVWGYGVNDSEMFTALLPRIIPDAEVVNMSVTGYSTDQELLVYEDEGHKYNADVVVLVFCMNDVIGNTERVQYATYEKPIFVLDHDQLQLQNQPVRRSSWWKRAIVNVTSSSYIANAVYRIIADRRVANAPELQADTNSVFPSSPAEQVTARLLLDFKRAVSEKQPDTNFILVLVDDMTSKYAHQIADYLAPSHIDTLVLNDQLDHQDRSLHLPDENHWSPTGNEAVAKIVASYLSSRFSSSSR